VETSATMVSIRTGASDRARASQELIWQAELADNLYTDLVMRASRITIPATVCGYQRDGNTNEAWIDGMVKAIRASKRMGKASAAERIFREGYTPWRRAPNRHSSPSLTGDVTW